MRISDWSSDVCSSDLGLPLCRAALAHRRGRYGETVDALLPHRAALRLVGGSRAQRDLFEQLLIDAAVKADRRSLARALLSERAATRRPNEWNRPMAPAVAPYDEGARPDPRPGPPPRTTGHPARPRPRT